MDTRMNRPIAGRKAERPDAGRFPSETPYAPPDADDESVMEELRIHFDGRYFHWAGRRYMRLQDAVRHAQAQQDEEDGGAEGAPPVGR